MTAIDRQYLIQTILERESLRPLSRISRLLKSPIRTLPYYLLATLGHLRPFPITFKTLWNTDMTCHLPEGNTFYYYGYCEANLTNFFLRYLREGMTILDVGAHVGIYSMLGSALVGETGSVHSFEPTPRTFKLLQKNTAMLQNVAIYNQAVAAQPGSLSFADYGAGYGAFNSAHSAGGQGIQRAAQHITVQSVSVDVFCEQHTLSPTLLKIDAEGFEYEVLKGALDTLKNHRPLITLEVAGGSKWAKNRADSFALLAEHQYSPFEILPDGTIAKHALQASYSYDNLLFIPKERAEESLVDLTTTPR